MDTAGAIQFLRSVRTIRAFKPDPIPDQALTDILRVARWTGSAMNAQPWELVVVSDPEVKQALAEAGGNVRQLAQAPLGIVVVLANTPGRQVLENFDEGRLSERIMIAAAVHGIGSGIAWFSEEGRIRAREILGAPADRLIRTVVSIGYPEPVEPKPPTAQPRKPLSRLVHYDMYGANSEPVD